MTNANSPLSFGFGSDNHASVHPEIMDALNKINRGHAPSYGIDPLTQKVRELFREIFGPQSQTFFVFNGTAANVLCLRALLSSHEAVLATDVSHLACDECAAPEFHGGHKILTVPHKDGKLTVEDIASQLVRRGDQHAAQLRLVSITQPTELGTVYSLDELKAIREFTRRHHLLLHMDGARLAQAVCYLQTSFLTLTGELGLDALSLGGTKNGLLGAEAVILFHPQLTSTFRFIQKQEMQLPSKVRYIAAQFEAYFQQNLWKRIAEHVLNLAQNLAQTLAPVHDMPILYPVQSNAVFVKLPKEWVQPLRETCFFYVWDEKNWVARLMLSHDNRPDDIQRFQHAIDQLHHSRHSPNLPSPIPNMNMMKETSP